MALQHLRSSTADKRPTPAAMSDGQLALNTNLVSPGLFFKDSNGDSVKIGPVHVGTTAPNATPGAGGQAGNSKGEAWLDTTAANPILKVWNGSAFVAVQPVGTGTVVSTTDTGTVTSTMILDGTILNADVNASAAIAGTKISPDFGSQTVTTTGVISSALGAAATPSITFTGDLNTGIYSPGADQVAVATNGTGRLFVDANGNVGVGTSSPANFAGYVTLALADSSGSEIDFIKGSTVQGSLYNANDIFYVESKSTVPIAFATNNTERLRIDSAGLVGIGTSSPQVLLHGTTSVSSSTEYAGVGFFENSLNNVDTNPTTAFPVLKLTRAGKSGITFRSSASLGIARYEDVGAAARSRLDIALGHGVVPQPDTTVMSLLSSGAVGIGTTPDVRLHVADTASGSGIYVAEFENLGTGANTEARLLLRTQAGSDNTDCYIGSLGSSANNSNLTFATEASATLSEKVRIDFNGRLLVGTSNRLLDNTNDLVQVLAAGGGGIVLGLNDPSVFVGNLLGKISFAGRDATGSVYAAFAEIKAEADGTHDPGDNPSRLVFSVTRVGGSSPTEAVRIKNTGYTTTFATTDGFRVSSAAAAGTGTDLFGGAHSAAAIDTGTVSFRVTTNGNTTNTNNSYAGISDIKLKENIADANSQWNDLKALQVRKYNFKEETGQQTHTQIGLVAQEVELVSPGLVNESPDRDEDGNDLGTVTKSVNYSVLYMKAVKALQEAMERIETLEGMVAVNNITIDEQQHQLSTLAARLTALESA